MKQLIHLEVNFSPQPSKEVSCHECPANHLAWVQGTGCASTCTRVQWFKRRMARVCHQESKVISMKLSMEKKLKEGITTWTLCSVTRTSVGKSQRGWTLYTDKRCDERQAGDSSGALSGKSSSPVSLQRLHSIQHSELLSSDPEKHTFHSTSDCPLWNQKPESFLKLLGKMSWVQCHNTMLNCKSWLWL